jgi:hypothetical protein
MFWSLLKGKSLSYFEHQLMKMVELEDELIELVLGDVGLEYIPKRTIHVQKYYMRQNIGL